MKTKLIILLFALIEISLGCITLLAIVISLITGKCTKAAEVLMFVLATSAISTALGIGILKKSLAAYHLLIYFSSIIIFSKILVFGKIIVLSGALETTVPSPVKNIISIIYHSLLMFYFTRKQVRAYFGEKRNVLFSIKLPGRQ